LIYFFLLKMMEGLPNNFQNSPVFMKLGDTLKGHDLMTMTLLAVNPDIYQALEHVVDETETFKILCRSFIDQHVYSHLHQHEGEMLQEEVHSCSKWMEQGPKLVMTEKAHLPTLATNATSVLSAGVTSTAAALTSNTCAVAGVIKSAAHSSALSTGGPVLMIAVFGMEMVEHITKWRIGEISGKRCAVRVARSLASVGGTIKGITAGALVGSSAGPAGTVVGGFVGGVCGMFLAGQLVDWLFRRWFKLPQEEAVEKAYRTLGIPCDAPIEEINQAYRGHLKKFHPDNRDGGDLEKFLAAQVAMEVIRSHRQKNVGRSAAELPPSERLAIIGVEDQDDEAVEDDDSFSDFEEISFMYGCKMEIICEGYLKKAGWFNHSYKKRYFVLLSGGRLEYFLNESKSKLRGQIWISSDTTMELYENTEYAFRVQTKTPKKRKWYFRAESLEERDRWMTAIAKAISEAPAALASEVAQLEPEVSVESHEGLGLTKPDSDYAIGASPETLLHESDVEGSCALLPEVGEKSPRSKPGSVSV